MERINTLKDSFVNLIPNKKGGMRKPVSTCMSTQPGTLTSTLASKENKGPVGRFFGYLDTLTNEEEKEALMDKFNTNLDRFGITINSGAFQVNGRGLADITKGAGKNTDDRLRFIVALVALDLIPHSVYMNPSIISEGISEEEKARLESKAQIQKKAGMIELINKLCISCHGMLRHFKMPNQGNLSQTFGGYVVEGGFGFRKPKDSTKTDHHLTSKGFTVYKQTSPSCSIFGKSKPHNAFQQRFTHSQTNRDPLTYITEKNGAYRTAINNEEGSVQFSSDNIDQIFHGISDLKNNNAKEFIATVLFGEREASVGADGSVIVAEDALRQWGGGIIDLSRPTIMVKSDTDFIGMLKDEFFKLNLDEQLNKFGFDEAKIYEINAEPSTPMKILKIYNTLYGITGTTISIQEPQSQFKKNWGDGGVELENVFSFFPGLTVPSAAAASGLEGINYDTNLFLMTEAQQIKKINDLYKENKHTFKIEQKEGIDNLKDQLEDESLDKTARTVIIQAILEAKKDLLIKKGILVEDADNVNALRQALKLAVDASLDDIRGYLELDADAEITKVTVDEKIAELKKDEDAAKALAIAEAEKEAASGLEGINYDTNLFLMTEAQQKNKINALYHKNKGNFESEENEVIDNLKDQLEDESLDKTARTVIIQAILEAKKDLLIKKGILVEDADNVNALRQALKLDEKASLDDIRGYLELDADAEITKVTVDEKIAELKKAEEAAKALEIAEAEKEAASGLEGINYDTNLSLMTEVQQKNKINALYHKNKGNFESEENEVIDNLKDQLEDESLDKTARTVIIQAILEAKKDLLIKKGILVEDADNVNALRQALKLDEKASLDDIRGYLELDADAEITKVTVDEKIAELKKAEEAATAVGTGAEVVNDGGELPTAFPQRSSLSESEHALQLRSYMQAHLSIFSDTVVGVEEAFWKDVATVADYSYVTLLTELGLYDSSEPAPDMRRLLFQMIQSLHLKCDTDEIHPIDRHIISNTDSLLAFGIITQKPEGVPYEYQPEHGPLEEIQHFVAENFIYEEESIRTNLQTLLTNIKTAHGQLEKKLTTAMNENPTQPFPSDIILENENDIQAIYEQIQSLLAANEEYLDIERLLNLMNALKESGAINNPGVEITLSHPSRRDSLTIIKQHNAQAIFIERLTPNKEKASETRSDEDSFEGSPSLVATTVSKTPHVHGVVVAETVHNAPLKIGQNAAGGGTPRQTPVRGQNAAGGGTPVGRVSNSAGGASVSVTPPTSLTVEHSTGTFNNSPPLPEEKKK